MRRIANSDMLEVSYENDDPGVVYNTLELLNDEFVKQYKELRYGETTTSSSSSSRNWSVWAANCASRRTRCAITASRT